MNDERLCREARWDRSEAVVSELLQWTAAVIVLVAYALLLMGRWPALSYRYLTSNLVGGIGLCAAAALSHQWGFVVVEAAWAAVAGWTMLSRTRAAQVGAPTA